MSVEVRPKQAHGHYSAGTTLPTRQSQATTQGNRNRTTACEACRSKKRKCEGVDGLSCLGCFYEGRDCVFDGDSDGRRRKNRDSLKTHQQLLLRLLEAIKTCPEARLYRLAKSIQRSGCTTSTLHTVLDNIVSSFRPVAEHRLALKTDSDDADEKYQHGISAARLSLPPPFENNDLTGSSVDSIQEHCNQSRSPGHANVECTSGSSHLAASGDLNDSPLTFASGMNFYSTPNQRHYDRLIESPNYLCTPNIVGVSSQTDSLTLSTLAFVQSARSRILGGETIRDLLSMDGFDVELIFRSRRQSDPHNVSTCGCETTNTWPHFPLTVRLAMAYYFATFIRWLILPSSETWSMLSPMMRPLPSQLSVPHDSLWADMMPFPQLRSSQLNSGRSLEKLLTNADWASCNWPRTAQETVEMVQGRPTRLTEEFIRHVDDPSNWSLHESAMVEFSEWAKEGHTMRLHGDRSAVDQASSSQPRRTNP